MQRRWAAVIVVGSLLMVALQRESLFRLQFGNSKADLVIVFIGSCGVSLGLAGGLLAGLVGGLLQGAAQGVSVASVVASRALLGYVGGRLAGIVTRESLLGASAVAFAGTWACELTYYLFSPWIGFTRWLGVVGAEAVFNSLAAPFIHWILLGCLGLRRRV